MSQQFVPKEAVEELLPWLAKFIADHDGDPDDFGLIARARRQLARSEALLEALTPEVTQ